MEASPTTEPDPLLGGGNTLSRGSAGEYPPIPLGYPPQMASGELDSSTPRVSRKALREPLTVPEHLGGPTLGGTGGEYTREKARRGWGCSPEVFP